MTRPLLAPWLISLLLQEAEEAAAPAEGEAAVGTVKVKRLLTILEAVIIQTSLYAQRSKSRLAVFWGDQVFVPTQNYEVGDSPATHPADILAMLGPPPSAQEWTANGFSSYGLIGKKENGDAVQASCTTQPWTSPPAEGPHRYSALIPSVASWKWR